MCDDKDENENEGDSEGEHVIDMVNRDFCSIKNASRVYIDCCENDDDTDNGESKCNDEKDRKNRNGNYDDKNDDSDGNYDASDDHHSRNKDLDSYETRSSYRHIHGHDSDPDEISSHDHSLRGYSGEIDGRRMKEWRNASDRGSSADVAEEFRKRKKEKDFIILISLLKHHGSPCQ